MDVREAAVLRLAQRPHPSNDSQATLVLGQGEPSLFFRTVGTAELGTEAVEAAPNLACEMYHLVQGGEGTIVMIGGPHRLATEQARTPERLEGAGRCGERAR